MNELEQFEQLALQASREPVPSLDVAAGVLRDIRCGAGRRTTDAPLWIMAGVSAAAAAIVLALAIETAGPPSDPWAELFTPLTMVMQ